MPKNDPHAPLRRNIRMLGDIIGEVITRLESKRALNDVSRLRRLAQQARAGKIPSRRKLIKIISQMNNGELRLMGRAFYQFLAVANIAEQHHRVRRRRDYELQKEPHPQRGSVEELLPRLRKKKITRQKIVDSIGSSRIEFVLTAHPTEVQRRTMMQKYDRIADILGALDRPDLTPDETDYQHQRLKQTLLSAWDTRSLRMRKPTPIEEARWGFANVEETLWDAVPTYLRQLDQTLEEQTGQRLPVDCVPIRFSSWMGGDRDGNPFVTADVTREVVMLGRWQAAELLVRDLEQLRAELSMRRCNDRLSSEVGDESEPYRALLRTVVDKLIASQTEIERYLEEGRGDESVIYLPEEEVMGPLKLSYESLVEVGMQEIADGRLCDCIRKLTCFGMSLLTLDIRQDAREHAKLLNALSDQLGVKSYADLTENEKQKILLKALRSKKMLPDEVPGLSDTRAEYLATFRLIASMEAGTFGAYVISMAKSPSDVLAVYYLQQAVGVKQPLPVVPLFESESDLKNAGDAMDRLLSIAWYRRQIKGEVQVMIGYSDSAKDAGFLAASWAQYQAQEALTNVCREHDVHLTLFHGRGGTVSRGGASAHQALLSQPPGAVNGSVRVTEQGEVIRFKFGLPGIALRTMDVYTAATLEATLCPPRRPNKQWRNTMDHITEKSAAAYRDTVYHSEEFTEYFQQVTPIRELQKLSVGSRPARRTDKPGVENLRAIPWVFAWTQIRMMLPAWYGAGVTLGEAISGKDKATLRDMVKNWSYFRNIMGMLEMVLAKTEPEIAEHYEEFLADKSLRPFGKKLRTQLQATEQALKKILGQRQLLADSPVIRRSIAVRNPYTDVLNLLQSETLARYRKDPDNAEPVLEEALMIATIGIAAGLRNTG